MVQAPDQVLRTAGAAYRVFDLVASGAFGSVYYGRNLADNEPVAIKFLHPHHAGDPQVVGKFEQEAATVRGLAHPNIVQVLDQGRTPQGIPFIVMEWVTGWTIAALIEQRGVFPPGEAAAIGCHVLSGLEAARLRGVVHRDIKPLNLMVTSTGQVKVMDFGIAKEAALATAAGASGVMGTPAYMAPEQFREAQLDSRTDLYALGVTMYQMLAGVLPFRADTVAGYMYQHLNTPPPPLVTTRPGVDPQLAGTVQRALEKSPTARWPTPAAMQTALEPFATQPVSRPSAIAPPPKRRPKIPTWALAAIVGLVVLAAGAVLVKGLTEAGPSPRPTFASVPPPTVTPVTGATSTGVTACQAGLSEASSLAGRTAWAEAAAKLESLRSQGCEVAGPLFTAYLNQARTLADAERTDDAIDAFGRALQVKPGDGEALRERELAVAYKTGRDAIDRRAWATAIDQLSRVYPSSSGYAHGNLRLHLINAYLGSGDELLAQQKPCDAQAAFQRAADLKANDPSIAARLTNAQGTCAPTLTALIPTATPPPTSAAKPADAEDLVHRYYQAIDNRDYAAAYGFMSRAAQARQSLGDFSKQFSDTLTSIGVRFVDGINLGSASGSLAAHTTTVSKGSPPVRQCWRVSWQLVLEDGQWKREQLAQASEAC